MSKTQLKTNELRHGNLFETTRNTNKKGWYVDRLDVATEFDLIEEFPESYRPIVIDEELLIKYGWKYYNGKTKGDLTMDFGGKLDVDFIDGKMMIKSHYEGRDRYRLLHNIKYAHHLQNFYYVMNGEELTINP